MLWVPSSDLNEEESAMEKGMQVPRPQGSKQLKHVPVMEEKKAQVAGT